MTFRALCAIAALAVLLMSCSRAAEPVTAPAITETATQPTTPTQPSTSSGDVAERAAEIAAAVKDRTGPAAQQGPFFFSRVVDNLTFDEHAAFIEGQFFFNEIWTQVGPRETASDGLGPLFNAASCDACHRANGRRGGVSPDGFVVEAGLLVRLSVPGTDPVTGEQNPEPTYGHQLQDRSLGQQIGEGLVAVEYEIESGAYSDGTPWQRQRPRVSFTSLSGPALDPSTRAGMRSAGPLIGMGMLEAVPAESILALADPDDADGDGISGRPNMVWDPLTESLRLGRFGWKANVVTLEHQTALAFAGDIGITSPLIPEENCTPAQSVCDNTRSGGTFEVSQERVDGTLDYLRALAVPGTQHTGEGAQVFDSLGCASCHSPTLETGSATLEVLSDITIASYTDLLLHDMGDGLADNRSDGQATGSEWRTAPLWGLGQVNAATLNLLHDGRARSIEEAILWHGGEAESSRQRFLSATVDERRLLLAFLGTL